MTTQVTPPITMVVKLDQTQLAQLEKQLPGPDISSTTTELEAGQKLGIQRVLRLLRDGFTYYK